MLTGEEWTTAHAGDLVYVPRSGVHGFRAAGPDIGARFLILFTPGIPRADYFRAWWSCTPVAGRRRPRKEIDAFALQHDQLNLRD